MCHLFVTGEIWVPFRWDKNWGLLLATAAWGGWKRRIECYQEIVRFLTSKRATPMSLFPPKSIKRSHASPSLCFQIRVLQRTLPPLFAYTQSYNEVPVPAGTRNSLRQVLWRDWPLHWHKIHRGDAGPGKCWQTHFTLLLCCLITPEI